MGNSSVKANIEIYKFLNRQEEKKIKTRQSTRKIRKYIVLKTNKMNSKRYNTSNNNCNLREMYLLQNQILYKTNTKCQS